MGPKKNPKRQLSEDDANGKTTTPTTPVKSELRDDGHFATPKKSKLNLNFWETQATSVGGSGEPSSSTHSSVDNPASVKPEGIPETKVLVELKPGSFAKDAVEIRVTCKSPKKVTPTGSVVFDFHGLDKSGEVAFVCFGKVAEAFFEKIEVNGLYRIENYVVQEENSLYPSGAGSGNLQITLRMPTTVTVLEDFGNIPPIPFVFCGLDELEGHEVGVKADVCGILVEVAQLERVKSSKTGRELLKREIGITDKSKSMISVTLWGSAAEQFSANLFSPIAIRKSCLSEFQGKKSLNALNHTLIWVNPGLKECLDLQDWFEQQQKQK